jgi:hypothetical protein
MNKQDYEALQIQFTELRKNGGVSGISIHTAIGDIDISNKRIINSVTDLLILETMKEINDIN